MSRQSQFASNFILMVVLNIAVKLFWLFGVDRTVQNQLGGEVYGNYFSIFQYAWIFLAIADMGINSLNNRMISNQTSRLSFYLHNLLFFKIILSAVVLLLMFLIGLLIGYSKEELILLIIVGLNFIMLSFYSYLRSNITGLHLFTTESIFSVLDKFIMVLISSCFLWLPFFQPYFNIYVFASIQVIGFFLASIVVYMVLKPYVKSNKKNRIHFKFIRKFIRTSAPYALLGLLMALYTRTDSVLLERMLPDGNYQSGIYANGFRILDAFNMFAVLMASFLLPIFSRNIFKKQLLQPIVKQGFILILLPVSGVVAFMTGYYKEFYDILYEVPVEQGATVFLLFVLCFIPMSLGYIFGSLLTAKGEIKKLNYISLAALVFNILLNIYFIPSYKSLGVAVIAICTQSFAFLLQLFYCIQIFKLKMTTSMFFKIVLLLVLSAGTGLLFSYFSIPVLIGLAGIALTIFALFFIFGLVKFDQLKLLKKS